MRNAVAILGLLGFALGIEAAEPERRFAPPEAKHQVRLEKTVLVPMRDGVKLSTDLYFPQGLTGSLATVLVRTPYNKKDLRREGSPALFFAGQGYVVAVQDVRGKFESEGEFVIQGHDAEDGFDTVEWLSTRPWSNGKVGTYGCSYLGDVQIHQSKLRHPALAAMIPQAAGSSVGPAGGRYRYFGARNGGAFELAAGVGWFHGNGSKLYYRPPPGTPLEDFRQYADLFDPAPKPAPLDFRRTWPTLPLIDMMERVSAPPTDWKDVLGRDLTDPWWDEFGYLKDSDRFDVPALHVNSWYDFGVAETLFERGLLGTNADSARGRENQFAVISPTTHCQSERATADTVVGERNLGDARFDYWGTYLRWFDYWLRGIENGVTEMPKIQIYVMGRNQWRAESEWPLARARFTRYYLHSDGRANSRSGSGALDISPPTDEPPDRYVYDPENPVPSRGGAVCCTGTPDAPEGSFDQSEIEARDDVLVYSTPPLTEGIEITGSIEAVLYVSSSAVDTDFTAKLVDAYPDGTAYNVQEGILRARYRQGFDRKVWMKAGDVVEVRIDLQATSNYFPPGHRIRLEVSSSNFPRFDRNLNTGGNNFDEVKWIVAENAVHHDQTFPSYLLLPIIPPQ